MSIAVIATSMVIGTAALMILGVQPVLLGALAPAHRVTDAQLGFLATVENLALALGSGVGPRLMRGGMLRLKVIILSIALAGADLAVFGANSALTLEGLGAVAGLLEGLVLSVTIVVMIESDNPDRLNALFLSLSTIPQVLLAYCLPVFIVPRFGSNGGFGVLAVLAVLEGVCGIFLADVTSTPAAEKEPVIWSLPVVGALLAVLFQNAAIGGAWEYLQLLADQHGFSPAVAGAAVAGGLGLQVLGALAAAAWGRRFSFFGALMVGVVGQTCVLVSMALAHTPTTYLAASLALGLFWLALSPFQVRLLIALDKTRRAALLLTAATLLGLSLGPMLSAFGVNGKGVSGAFWVAATVMAGAAGLYSALALKVSRSGIDSNPPPSQRELGCFRLQLGKRRYRVRRGTSQLTTSSRQEIMLVSNT